MRITKFGHCCLLLEVLNRRIIVDPGRFSDGQNSLTDIDMVLITHEHADHYHTDSVSEILRNNPSAIVVTNTSVAELLKTLGVTAHILEGAAEETICDVPLSAHDGEHVEIFGDFEIVQNTGYFVADTFFFPGDAYTIPNKPVTILALPVAGPWCKASDAAHYAIAVRPKIAIPVHDATLSEVGRAVTYGLFERELPKEGIEFVPLANGESYNG